VNGADSNKAAVAALSAARSPSHYRRSMLPLQRLFCWRLFIAFEAVEHRHGWGWLWSLSAMQHLPFF